MGELNTFFAKLQSPIHPASYRFLVSVFHCRFAFRLSKGNLSLVKERLVFVVTNVSWHIPPVLRIVPILFSSELALWPPLKSMAKELLANKINVFYI